MRILGIDYGTKRIGLAMSDELMITAQPFRILYRTALPEDLAKIAGVVADHGITEIVMGFPLNMNGTQSAKTKEVVVFMDELARAVTVPIKTWDERLSTAQVERSLIDADMSRAKRKKITDKLAAQVILQSYLDSRKRGL